MSIFFWMSLSSAFNPRDDFGQGYAGGYAQLFGNAREPTEDENVTFLAVLQCKPWSETILKFLEMHVNKDTPYPLGVLGNFINLFQCIRMNRPFQSVHTFLEHASWATIICILKTARILVHLQIINCTQIFYQNTLFEQILILD